MEGVKSVSFLAPKTLPKLFLPYTASYTEILLKAILSFSEIHSAFLSTPMLHLEDGLHAGEVRSCETSHMLYMTWLVDSCAQYRTEQPHPMTAIELWSSTYQCVFLLLPVFQLIFKLLT